MVPLPGPPKARFLAVEKKIYRGDRANGIVSALRVPGGDAGVKHGIRKREEHLHIVVEGVMVAGGNKLRELLPVTGRLSVPGPSDQYSAIIFYRSVKLVLSELSSSACC